MNRKIGWCVIVVAAMLLISGVQLSKVSGGAVKKEKVSLLVYTMNPFYIDLVKGAKDAGKELGADVKEMDAKEDAEMQMRQMEDSLVFGANGILLVPIEVEALIGAVKMATREKVPVVTVDRDVKGGGRLCYVGTDNVKAAENGANKLIELLEGTNKQKPWKIVILEGTPGSSTGIERGNGFHQVLKPLEKRGEIEIVADLPAQFDRARGMTVMEDILAIAHDIDGVICANDEMALGALSALKSGGFKVGYPDGVIIVGFDAIGDAVEAIKRGELSATVAQSPYIMGYWGIEVLLKNIREGWEPPKTMPIYEPTGAYYFETPTLIVTRDNVMTFESITKSPAPIVWE